MIVASHLVKVLDHAAVKNDVCFAESFMSLYREGQATAFLRNMNLNGFGQFGPLFTCFPVPSFERKTLIQWFEALSYLNVHENAVCHFYRRSDWANVDC